MSNFQKGGQVDGTSAKTRAQLRNLIRSNERHSFSDWRSAISIYCRCRLQLDSKTTKSLALYLSRYIYQETAK